MIPKRAPRARNYCFTLNFGENAPFQLTPDVDGWPEAGVKYCVWQLEVGDEGNLHLQGYLELESAVSMVWVHSNLSGLASAALFARSGSALQAAAYCMKAESRVEGPWSFGVGLLLPRRGGMVFAQLTFPNRLYLSKERVPI